ncbi:MAG: hypothetical protein DDT19_00069 [Syntrophomonadaceae bacterium]|nr:hypothetical protein [Bacillota bacterium]
MDKREELKSRLWELHGDLQSIATLIEEFIDEMDEEK